MSVFSLRLSEKITLLIESEAKKTGRSKNEILRNYIEAGMVKDSSSGGSGSVYDALQILRNDLLADLKRAIPAPAATPAPTPAPSIVTQKIDISELKNELLAEVKKMASLIPVQQQTSTPAAQMRVETAEIKPILDRAMVAIEDSNQLKSKLISAYNGQYAVVQSIKSATETLASKPDIAPGISREDFAEFVQTVREEIEASRKFQKATSDFIVQSVSQFQNSLASVATSIGNDALAPVANQIKSFETRALALVRMVGEDAFLARQYSGETLRGTLDEKKFDSAIDEIQKEDLQEMRKMVAKILA